MDENVHFFDDQEISTRVIWLMNASTLTPGGSAIIGNNKVAFFTIHHTALSVIIVSLFSSFLVISKLISKWCSSKSKLDFSTRLPLYLALADFAWGLSHFTDHLYLVIFKTFPSSTLLKMGLSINLWFFFGYQQLMHATVAGYTYFAVVHGRKFNLGTLEWKLHMFCFSFLAISVGIFASLNSFGNTGYWMAHDATTISGQILGAVICLTSSFNACSTTVSYLCIRRTVMNSKANLRAHVTSGSPEYFENSTKRHHSMASKCLTTFVWVASGLYCPLAVLLWINLLFQVFLGAIEPLTSGLITIVANSSGWANTYAYFYNEKLKRKKVDKGPLLMSPPNSSISGADA